MSEVGLTPLPGDELSVEHQAFGQRSPIREHRRHVPAVAVAHAKTLTRKKRVLIGHLVGKLEGYHRPDL